MTGKTISHYEILDELGRGGMGVVYRANDKKLDRVVALKFLPDALGRDDSSRERFMVEAKASAKLTHANICTIHEVDDHEGQMFMVMECIEGVTLKERLQNGVLPLETAISFAAQIAKGLERAHEAGITHRDIKPANIMVTDRDELKILDFGLAKFAGGVDLTKTGSTMGTAAYMSPEQMRGEQIDHRADIWALGAVFYELLTGSRPFAGDYEAAVGYAILNEDPEPLSTGLPDGLEEIVTRCLTKKPGDRYQSANDFLQDLAPLTSGIGSTICRSISPAASRKPNIGIIAVGVLAIAALVWFLMPFGSSDDETIVPDAIAVFPFSIQGDAELAFLRAGLVFRISNKMDGVGSIKTVDPNRVLARVSDEQNSFFDPDESGLVAAGMSANRFVIGSVVRTGTRTEMVANVYDLDGNEIGEANTTFEQDAEIPGAIDDLALQLIRIQLEGTSMQSAELVTPTTTTSFEALKYLIEAETAIRAGDARGGRELAEQAISHDSTLATAWYVRYRGYVSSSGNPRPQYDDVEPYKMSLPPRLQRLYKLSDFYQGTSEQRIQAFLREYPGDVQGIGMLGDILYHNNPRSYRSASEAIPVFQEVLELDPNNGEYSLHLYTQLLRDRRFEEADEFRKQQFPDDIRRQNVQAFIEQDSTQIAQIIEETRQRGRIGLGIGIHFQPSDGWKYLEMLDDSLRVDSENSNPSVSLSVRIKLAVGKIKTAKEYVAELDDPRAGFIRAQIALLPDSESDRVFLQQTESEILSWLVTPDSVQAILVLEALVEDVELNDVVYYLSALIRMKLQDEAGFTLQYQELSRRATEGGSESLAHHLVRRLDGLQYFQANELELALEALTEGLDYYIGNFTQIMLLSHDAVARSTRAEILARLGRYEEAIATYRSLNDGFDWVDAPWVGPGFLRRAQWYEELGDNDSAIDFYGRLVELWEDADPHLQPQVEDARRRIDVLLDSKAREN